MNPAQLLNPKGYKKEQAKAKKRAPNYGESSLSYLSSRDDLQVKLGELGCLVTPRVSM